jgi:ketosteroid isomerase-like protein
MKRILLALLCAAVVLSACNNEKVTQLEQITKEIEMKSEIAERNKTNTLAFLKALEEMNTDAVVNLFAEDGVHINPYASGLFPEGTKGKEGVRAYWEPVFPNFEKMEFPVEEIYSMNEAAMTFVKFKGKIKLKNDAGWYKNDYYATFKFNEEGKITEYVEIFNPIVAAKGFGLLDQIK